MLYLLLSVLSSVLIGNLLMLFLRDKDADILTIFLGNYIVAALFSLGLALPSGLSISNFDLWFAALTGLLFLGNFLTYQNNIGINGLSLSMGTMRVSVIIPTLMAAFLFAEKMNLVNLLGIVIIVGAFSFVTDTKSLRNLFWLLFLFIITGVTESTLNIFNEYGSGNRNMFLALLFCSSGIYTAFVLLYKKRRLKASNLLYGFGLGIPNMLSSFFFLKALQSVSATIAYPLSGAGIVIGGIICDLLIWKRIFSPKQKLALALLALGVIIVSLGR